MHLISVKIEKPEEINFILGQSHFIKTVEDLHEVMVNTVPGIKFGLAFCEASGACLVRWSGTDAEMIELARKNAQALGAGHSFIIFLGSGYYPINMLNNTCFFINVLNPPENLARSEPFEVSKNLERLERLH